MDACCRPTPPSDAHEAVAALRELPHTFRPDRPLLPALCLHFWEQTSMKGCFTAIARRAAAASLARDGPRRLMGITAKAVNRAAEHGTRSPVTQSVNIEKVEQEINKGKEEKQRKEEEVEKKVDSRVECTTEDGSS